MNKIIKNIQNFLANYLKRYIIKEADDASRRHQVKN